VLTGGVYKSTGQHQAAKEHQGQPFERGAIPLSMNDKISLL
jgi:hypothetical protein